MAPNPSEHVEDNIKNASGATAFAESFPDKNLVKMDQKSISSITKPFSEFHDQVEGARAATVLEHEMTILQTAKKYPMAIFYSLGISLAIIMEGYDTGLLGNFFGLPQFRQKFGHELANGDYQLSVPWQSGLGAGSSVGGIFGLFVAGILVDRFGYRLTMYIGLSLLTSFIFLTFFAQNIIMLFFGNLLCGIPWGMFQGMASSYAADVTPLCLRPILTSYINLCWVTGQFISTGVLRGFLNRQDQWAWRIPFAIQWVWPLPIAAVVLFAPESPWWLVRKGRMDEARQALRKLASKSVTAEEIDNTVSLICLTNEHEKQVSEGTAYTDLFRGTNLRRTEISAGAWVCQVTCGIWFPSYITYFMQQAGASPSISFAFGLGMNGVAFLGTILSWFLVPHIGRRTLYTWGLSGILVTFCIVGFLGIPSGYPPSVAWASGAMLILNVLIFDLTIGPVAYTIVPEVPSTRLRNKTVSFARACYSCSAIGANFLNPPLMNPTGWNLKGRGAFVWGATCFLSLVWAWFRLPETKGRNPAELDILFENKVKTRAFKGTQVEVFGSADNSNREQKDASTIKD